MWLEFNIERSYRMHQKTRSSHGGQVNSTLPHEAALEPLGTCRMQPNARLSPRIVVSYTRGVCYNLPGGGFGSDAVKWSRSVFATKNVCEDMNTQDSATAEA